MNGGAQYSEKRKNRFGGKIVSSVSHVKDEMSSRWK